MSDEKIETPSAMLYRLIETNGTVWQLGKRWPTPAGLAESDVIDCKIATILFIDSETDEKGEVVDIEPYYQIVGLPIEGGKFAKREYGVSTDLAQEHVYRTEGLQNAKVLAAYCAEMVTPGSARMESAEEK